MANLVEPSLELATAVLRRVEYDERLAGFRLDGATGHHAQDLYSLEDVVKFLSPDPWDFLMGPAGRGQIAYIDLPILSRWVAEVLGDAELSEAIREAIAQETVYARQVALAEELMEQRVRQCQALVEEERAAATEQQTAAAGEQTESPGQTV